MATVHWQMVAVFVAILVPATILGFTAGRWRSSNLNRLQEWGLAGRRFGPLISWFVLSGDLYTSYAFIAVPGLVFGMGALGFYSVPYAAIAYPLAFIFLPRLWTISRHRGYITVADFVHERFDSSILALAIAVTGILAMMPYTAVQLIGMQVVLSQMGIPVEAALFIAFAVLALYTYFNGLRAPALLAIVKDVMIVLIVLVTFIYIPAQLGGFEHIFAAVHLKAVQHPRTFSEMLSPAQYSSYATLALGSTFAVFLYPHNLTGVLSTNSGKGIKRIIPFLPIYSVVLSLIALCGYMAIAAHIQPQSPDQALPALFAQMFPEWFTGFAFAALAIGALVPAAIMSIGAANLFTRNIYRAYFRPSCREREESNVAKLASLLIKIGAFAFVAVLPKTFSINLQLLGGVWILQTLPAVFLGLYTKWFHRHALLIGWLVGMVTGTWISVSQNFASVSPFALGGFSFPIYVGLIALTVNLCTSGILTLIFDAVGIARGQEVTTPQDFEEQPTFSLRAAFQNTRPTTESASQPLQEGVSQAAQGYSSARNSENFSVGRK
jgi:SSS family solute:Na+ symporter